MRFHILIVLFALLAVVAAHGRPQRGQQGGSQRRPQFGGLPPNGTLIFNANATTTTEASSTADSTTIETVAAS